MRCEWAITVAKETGCRIPTLCTAYTCLLSQEMKDKFNRRHQLVAFLKKTMDDLHIYYYRPAQPMVDGTYAHTFMSSFMESLRLTHCPCIPLMVRRHELESPKISSLLL